MLTVKGYVYGHYDSRGGTTFVRAENREEADRKYVKYYWGEEERPGVNPEEFTQWLKGVCDEDFMFHAALHVPDGYALDTESIDLEVEGMVIHKGNKSLKDWPRTQDDLNRLHVKQDFCQIEQTAHGSNIVELEFVPEGNQPVRLTNWEWPRWDDDAFSFLVI